jgi:dTDP-4-dehydrorhamnose reductase
MVKHDKDPSESIKSNIIGTSNVVLACMEKNIKLVYVSTDYVYPGTSGQYSEDSPILPFNKYGWSKMGGECAVRLYNNSLILRICMNNKPFPHPKALVDVKKSLIFDDEAAEIVLRLLNESGVINIGGTSQSIYEFVKEHDDKIERISLSEINDVTLAPDTSMCLDKMRSLLND